VPDLWNEDDTVARVRDWLGGREVSRVECLWEPGVVLAARLREAFGVPGMTVERAFPFRDKESMKQVLDAAGVRTPHHYRACTADEVRDAKERIGYPIIIKPVAGAGSADTYPIRDDAELEDALERTRHVEEVSVEEYVEGDEYTFDTVCANGEILFYNVALYRPKPLLARLNPWICSQAFVLKDTERSDVRKGRALGERVLQALGFESGFTHMEWFLTPDGEAIFGEIGARAPGARLVHAMNYSCDIDLFTGWAEAVCHGRLSQDTHKKYNCALVFKRADGEGTVCAYDGLEPILAEHGEHIASIELTPIGEPKRDWTKVVVGDGWIVARHPDLETTMEISAKLTSDFQIIAR